MDRPYYRSTLSAAWRFLRISIVAAPPVVAALADTADTGTRLVDSTTQLASSIATAPDVFRANVEAAHTDYVNNRRQREGAERSEAIEQERASTAAATRPQPVDTPQQRRAQEEAFIDQLRHPDAVKRVTEPLKEVVGEPFFDYFFLALFTWPYPTRTLLRLPRRSGRSCARNWPALLAGF